MTTVKDVEVEGIEVKVTSPRWEESLKCTIEVDVTQSVLAWLCEKADPSWVAGQLLNNDSTRAEIFRRLTNQDYNGSGTTRKMREEFLEKVERAHIASMAHELKHALEVCEKYQRAYWDFFHLKDSSEHVRADCQTRRMKGPEFFEHSEDPAHDWPSVREEIEKKVLAAFYHKAKEMEK